MIVIGRWIRLCLSFFMAVLLSYSLVHKNLIIYLAYQAKGQLSVILNTETISEYKNKNKLSVLQKSNLQLIKSIREFSVDSLGYKPTSNFSTIYNQHQAPVLWVVTASESFQLKEYFWDFPILGKLSYKGFFKKELAVNEFNNLKCKGYDADIRPASAWSTLGWFSDPLMSSSLDYSKGRFCNLLFHELFHATYYLPNKVNLNENLAEFIAHKATIKFLKNDIINLNYYLADRYNDSLFERVMVKKATALNLFYDSIKNKACKNELKICELWQFSKSLETLNFSKSFNLHKRQKWINQSKNAYFVDFIQYSSLQDSLELVFNKIYNGNLLKMVQDLKGK